MDIASSKSNITKEPQEGLLILRKSTMVAKQDYDKFLASAAEAEFVKLKLPKSTQTETIAFAVNPKGTPDAIAYDKQL